MCRQWNDSLEKLETAYARYEFISNFAKNPEQAQEILEALKKIKKILKRSLPPPGSGPLFDSEFPDGENAFIVDLTEDDCVALASFSRKIYVEALSDLLGTKSAGTYAMRSIWAIRDAIHSHGLHF